MASELKVDKFTGVTTAGSIDVTGEGNSTTTNLQQGLVKQWDKFNQETPAVLDSFNLSSMTDRTTGTEGNLNRYSAIDHVDTGFCRFGATFGSSYLDVDELYTAAFGDLA